MRRAAYRRIQRRMIGAAVCAGIGAVLILPHVLTGRSQGPVEIFLISGSWLVSIVLLVQVWFAARRLGRGIEGVRTAVLNLVADRESSLPPRVKGGDVPEVRALLDSLSRYQTEIVRERQAPDRRLISVLAALPGGVVLMTETGQVSLLNGTARELLGAERARVGTSLYASLTRASVGRAVEKAAAAGRTVETVVERLDEVQLQASVTALPDDEGAVFLFPRIELTRHRPGVDFDLALHEVPPAREQLSLDVPLNALPAIIFDTETTGLDVKTDRIVSLGAVCSHGTRLFKSRLVDDLIDPGVPIPPESTKVHGITDAMVDGARAFPEVWADFQRLTRNRLVIGHNVPFDLTLLREECRRHGRPWEDLVFLDTMRLASLLNPTLDSWALENLADVYQIDLHGRHTALGDAMVTAELFFRMVPRLEQQGIATLGQLLEFHCKQAVDVIAGQRGKGWIVEQPEGLRRGSSADGD